MAAPRSSAAHASVLFATVPAFARQPVQEQARLKAKLESVVTDSIAGLRADERIVLDASEGMAVIVLADPAAALNLAWRAQSRDRELPLAIGLTHGPVRVSDDGQDLLVHGDGVVAAEVVSTFAGDGAVAITREFRDALARAAPGIARQLPGDFTSVDAADRAFELVRVTESSMAARRRRFLALTGAACAAIVALGGIVRWAVPGEPPPPVPGTVVFDIRPAGDIFLNGAQKGSTPPLKSIQLPPGTHTLEIRHEGFAPLVSMLTIAPGEAVAIAHTFAKAAPARPPPKPQPKPAWKRFLDKLKP